MLGFYFERDGCYVLKWYIISLTYKYVKNFITFDNMMKW